MFNKDMRNNAISDLENAVKTYEKNRDIVSENAQQLLKARLYCANHTIPLVEKYINTLSNSPQEFDKAISEYKAEFTSFKQICSQIDSQSVSADVVTSVGVGASIGAGVGVAAFAPTAAMGIATTFGVASTGTAISSLSGAAATNAALAWLGGGALAAGGGGITAGNAFLAMAGPVGWAIGGAALAGTGIFYSRKNKQIAEQAAEKRKEISVLNKSLLAANEEIISLRKITTDHSCGIINLTKDLVSRDVNDYLKCSKEDKDKLGALVNHIRSLSKLLNKKIDA